MRVKTYKSKNFGIEIGKPSAVLTDLEIKKLEKFKERVLTHIISRPKGTIKVEKDWVIDDSELNEIKRIEASDIIEAFSNKKTFTKIQVHRRRVTNKLLRQLQLKSKRA